MNLQLTNNETALTPEVTLSFFSDYSRSYISQMQRGEVLTKKKMRFSQDTIRQYKVSLDHFQNFEKAFSTKIRTHEINHKLLQAFERYLYAQGLEYNSVFLYISKVKAIANLLFQEEIAFRPINYATPKKQTQQVYLSFKELSAMVECNTLTTAETKVLDVFLVQCFTGLRYSTLAEFLEMPQAYIQHYEDKSYIDITAKKTGEQSIIPIGQTVAAILQKHGFKLPIYSEEYMNRTIKIVAKKAGINRFVTKDKTTKGVTETQVKEKWQMVSSHTARRTFISLAKQSDISDRVLMSITGHTTEKQLNSYNRSTNFDKVKNILGHEFFNYQF